MVWAAWRIRSSTCATLSASRTSSSADWSRATVRWVLSREPLAWVSLTIARWPLQRRQRRRRGLAVYTTRWDATLLAEYEAEKPARHLTGSCQAGRVGGRSRV